MKNQFKIHDYVSNDDLDVYQGYARYGFFAIPLLKVVKDVYRLQQRSSTTYTDLFFIFPIAIALTSGVLLHLNEKFPENHLVIISQLFLIGSKLAKWFSFDKYLTKKSMKSNNPYIIYILDYLVDISKLLDYFPSLLNYFLLVLSWEWLYRGDSSQVSDLANNNILPENLFTFVYELLGFSILALDQLIHIKGVYTKMSGRSIFIKLRNIFRILASIYFTFPLVSLLCRRYREYNSV